MVETGAVDNRPEEQEDSEYSIEILKDNYKSNKRQEQHPRTGNVDKEFVYYYLKPKILDHGNGRPNVEPKWTMASTERCSRRSEKDKIQL